MHQSIHPFVTLRRHIRQAAKQFRRNDDNSKSLFHPAGGFVYAYDITEIERALDQYELSMPLEFRPKDSKVTLEQRLIRESDQISKHHHDMDVRDFARTVAAYLTMHGRPAQENPLRLLNVDYLKPVDDLDP